MVGRQPWLLERPAGNPYFDFTDRCNADRMRLILASGQACVWYCLTLASKDGDWLVREEEADLAVIRRELERLGARYRLGAPLDTRWLAAGWSSHFEAMSPDGLRLRFDFVSRPPRIPPERLASLWGQTDRPAVIDPLDLIRLKQTMRLKDYAFVGSLALILPSTEEQVRYTLDAEHLHHLLSTHDELAARLPQIRPGFPVWPTTVEALAEAIDAETRHARQADQLRMRAYHSAMEEWAMRYRELDLTNLPLAEAHVCMVREAEKRLPATNPCENNS
jgi:hypothetical protein